MRPPFKIVFWLVTALVVVLVLSRNLGYFSSPLFLGGLILFEIVLASLWHFEVVFFPLLMCVFLCAGAGPALLANPAMSMRWVVLVAGAPAGFVLWMRRRHHAFTVLHLAAFSCVASALVSAMVSTIPMIALLKVASLFLLFLYCATGARLAIVGREGRFMRGLLLGCEMLVLLCAGGQLVGLSVLGNANSLGAVMGVAVTPLLFWGFLSSQTRAERYRRGAFLLLCAFLLYSSLSRASLLAAAVSIATLCVCLRRHRLLFHSAFVCILFLAIVAVARPSQFEEFVSDTTSNILYKGKPGGGLFGSRKTPWEQAVAVIKEHPWFGSGFGTSDVGKSFSGVSFDPLGGVYTVDEALREHGNSYLAVTEYTGLLGVVPFALLLFLVVRMIWQMCMWMRRTSTVDHPGIPIAMVLVAGLVHAFFEDWLFAVGYHLCVFFWTLTFLLSHFLPGPTQVSLRGASGAQSRILQPLPDPCVTSR